MTLPRAALGLRQTATGAAFRDEAGSLEYNANDSHLGHSGGTSHDDHPGIAQGVAMYWSPMRLSELPRRTAAIVMSVEATTPNDPIARRLRELGFVPGESVQVVALGPFGRDPMVTQVGFTRFALRRGEAARVTVELAATATATAHAVPDTASSAAQAPAQAEPDEQRSVA